MASQGMFSFWRTRLRGAPPQRCPWGSGLQPWDRLLSPSPLDDGGVALGIPLRALGITGHLQAQVEHEASDPGCLLGVDALHPAEFFHGRGDNAVLENEPKRVPRRGIPV